MTQCRYSLFLAVLAIGVVAKEQTAKTFPSDAEINLVLTQTERALQQYKPLIDREEAEMGKTDAIVRDRQVVAALDTAITAFKRQPQGFNGPFGFSFFEWLDDAARNAILCGSGAATQGAIDDGGQ